MSIDDLPLGQRFPLTSAALTRYPRGVIYLWRRPPIFITRVEGFLGDEAAQVIEGAVRKNLAEAKGSLVSAYHDWWEVDDYASEARTRLTTLGRETEKQSDRAHILLRSRLLAFGVQMASLLLNNLQAYSDRSRFLVVLESAVDKASRR